MIKVDIIAKGELEARHRAQNDYGLFVTRNVTVAYRREGCPQGEELKIFMINMMNKHKLTKIPGAALIIAMSLGKYDSSKKPYQINNLHDAGLKYKKHYALYLEEDPSVLLDQVISKGKAEQVAKQLVARYQKSVICKPVYISTEPDRLSFIIKFVPNKGSKKGQYIVFGNEAKHKDAL